jgi:hypothetical protein
LVRLSSSLRLRRRDSLLFPFGEGNSRIGGFFFCLRCCRHGGMGNVPTVNDDGSLKMVMLMGLRSDFRFVKLFTCKEDLVPLIRGQYGKVQGTDIRHSPMR